MLTSRQQMLGRKLRLPTLYNLEEKTLTTKELALAVADHDATLRARPFRHLSEWVF